MAGNNYDDIARILKEAVRRYPDDAFDDTRRLKGLLSDHLTGLNNEINIIIGALDEGIPEQLKTSGEQGVDITVNRLTERLEETKGIRGDIAKSAVIAIAHAMDITELPSSSVATISQTSQRQTDMPSLDGSDLNNGQGGADDWVGVSEVVEKNRQGGKTGGGATGGQSSLPGGLNDLVEKAKKQPLLIGVAAAAVAGVLYINSQSTTPQPPPGPQPSPQPSPQPNPTPPPNPQPNPTPPPNPQPQPNPTPPPNPQPNPSPNPKPFRGGPAPSPGPSANFYFADDNRNVWRPAPQHAGQGYGAFTAQISGQNVVMKSRPTGRSSFSFTVYNQAGQKVFTGTAKASDATHFKYSFQGSGQRGQGTWHVNHMPN